MATTSRLTMRQDLELKVAGWTTFTTTGAGNADKSTLVCATLGGFGDDFFKSEGNYGWIVLPTGPTDGTGSYEAHRIASFTGSTGTFTFPTGDYATAQVATAITFEYHRYNPVLMHAAINAAGRSLARRGLYLPVVDETLIVDNRLADSGANTYASSAFTSWPSAGSPTVSQESSIVWHGAYAFKIISAAGAAGQLTQTPTINVNELKAKSVKLRGSVWSSAADKARLKLDFDGSTFVTGTYHTGNREWRRSDVSISTTVPTAATQVKAIQEVVAGTVTAYFDTVALFCGTVSRYAVPTSFKYVDYVEQQGAEDEPQGSFSPLVGYASEGMILRLIGRGALTLPTSDTATMEVGNWDKDIVLLAAKQELYQMLKGDASGQERAFFDAEAKDAERQVNEAISDLRRLGGAARPRNKAWETVDESGTLYLYLRR